ncbi:DUF6766 family protein [Pseudoxanthomonas indica]|uniref:Transmembrane protein n=1 Tax=Pseudoxanthomonas indica TaxID=428993 RepID=A0A1T5JDR4_9GAMM|nr:DUF6766 family protein [Pseudoxanthomonas indica]GGD58167.1 hypothetical protein GCM10007235_33110 [Pseudoxanthomonas indica]SKC49717.1 hypothetical protein SAMN06296058_0733 [Pseudoxanthomonas indica]
MSPRAQFSFWRRNGLALTLLAFFLVFLVAQVFYGHAAWNEDRLRDHELPGSLALYLTSGHFISATFENWESEFLQMGMYVLLTVWLRQRGSAESRPLDPAEEEERVDPGQTPWPIRAGGIAKVLYAHSLALAFFLLFSVSFALHGYGSWLHENNERLAAGSPQVSLLTHLEGAQFWFESFQNWQSEFLAVLAIVVLSIFLRQDKSPESKPLRAPHSQTGT